MSPVNHLRKLCAAAAAAVALSALAQPASADEPVRNEVFDSEAYPPPSARGYLALAGLGVTAGTYGLAYGGAALYPNSPGADELKIPVVGPWMALAETGCAADNPDCSLFGVILRAVLTTVDGIGQVGGVAFMADALLMRTQEATSERRAQAAPRRSVVVLPSAQVAGQQAVGLSVSGCF